MTVECYSCAWICLSVMLLKTMLDLVNPLMAYKMVPSVRLQVHLFTGQEASVVPTLEAGWVGPQED